MQFVGKPLSYVLRRLVRSPLFTALSVVTLSAGIGANSAIFTVVYSVLLKPLPFDRPETLVGVWHTAPGLGFETVNQSPATYFTYREDARVFEDIGVWDKTEVAVTGLSEPERVDAINVTDGTLSILRVRPVLGRLFTREDDSPGSADTVILSDAYWRRRFGADPNVIGKTLTVDGRSSEIIGVLPARLRFLRFDPAIYRPMRFDRSKTFVGDFSYQALARLRPGVTAQQASDDLTRLIPTVVEKFPKGMTLAMIQQARLGPKVRPLMEDVVGDVRSVLWVLLGTVGIVLLVACANVANLFLVRAESRQQEIAIRTALGADRRQIAGELLGESVAVGLVSGIVGILLAYLGTEFLVALGPASLPRLQEITVDETVLAYTLGISVLAGLLFGLLSVFKYATPRLASALKEGGRGTSEGKVRHRARNALVVSQVALALVLLIGSGLMVRSFEALRRVEPGFGHPKEVLTLRVSIPSAEVAGEEETVKTHEQISRRIEAIPGVTSVGLSSSITMDGRVSGDTVWVEDFPTTAGQLPPVRRFKWISENYFKTMENSLLAGRDITWADIDRHASVAVVTENFAREYWLEPGAALGKRIREDTDSPWREIVGVVGNVHDDGVGQKAPSVVYWPMLVDDFWGRKTFTQRSMSYAIRTSRLGSPNLLREIRQAVGAVNSNLPLANVQTLDELLARSMAQTSFTLVMLGISGGVALLLGVVSIYGVISYIVSQRTREIGVRMALGAKKSDVTRMVLKQGLLLAAGGVGLGLGAAMGLTRLMSTLLFGVSPIDPATYAAVAVGLTGIALLASYIPARRAAGVDPTEALRWE